MLRRTARSPCARLAQLTPTARYGAVYHKPQPNTVVDRTQLRIFTTRGGVWREQNDSKSPPPRTPVDRIPQPPKIATSPAPASQKPSETLKPGVKKSDLLSEATITKQEQRKADWAIMKEMAKYLWPKVQWSTCVEPKTVTKLEQDDWGTKVRVGTALSLLVGAKVCRSR